MRPRPRPARAEDLLAVAGLLEQAGLPRAGLQDQFPAGFAVVEDEAGAPCAAAGVEVHGQGPGAEGLLRSVVVAPEARGRGLGAALVRERAAWAGARGLPRLWLLTTTAAPYFQGLQGFQGPGFEPASRAAAPPALQASAEFAGVCPASAACLVVDLTRPRRPGRIVSGGQTGADRGGLQAARILGIPHGGWCPRGRRAEDGQVPAGWDLRETESRDYAARTEWNVRDADAVLVLTHGPPQGGSLLTLEVADRLGRPALHLDLAALDERAAAGALRGWLAVTPHATLDVAGSRESSDPGLQTLTESILVHAFKT